MYSCNDCGEQFAEPENNACPKCGGGDIFEEDIEEATMAEETAGEAEVETAPAEETSTMEEVIADADEQNKKGLGVALRQFGEDYIRYKNNMECAKECIKSLFEMAKEQGITKGMIMAYAQAITLEEFNVKVLCSAVQQELGIEKISETEEKEAENTSDTEEAEVSDADEEQSENQGDA